MSLVATYCLLIYYISKRTLKCSNDTIVSIIYSFYSIIIILLTSKHEYGSNSIEIAET